MANLQYIPLAEIRRIRQNIADPFKFAPILADIVRVNTLYMIRYTGSGHPGSSFSSADIITWLWTQEMTNPNDNTANPSDIYFSSKGHDVPALYSLLIALEKIDFDFIHKLRRLHGLPGHPDRRTPYMITNTGPLGMGISKARGMAQALRLQNKSGRIYVLTGDGELQEGQIWESLQPTANGKYSEITVIVDHNKIQSDILVQDTSNLGILENKFRSFGWEVARCDGHDFEQLSKTLAYLKTVKSKPQVLIANTTKGKGVSFMEQLDTDGFYKFHSGAPSFELYQKAVEEIVERVNKNLAAVGQKSLELVERPMPSSGVVPSWERLIPAYGDELIKIARERKDLVVMDADLILDTGLIPFKKEFPARYIQCGIAEQDMVSMAGGLALKGLVPVVHSFACFLTTRANEQFYNNATEKTKIIYVGSLAGLLPAMPGHSHQMVRDISTVGSIPGLTIIEPANEQETRLALRWAVEKNPESTYIRLISIANECPYVLPLDHKLELGRGVFLTPGKQVAIVAYGPLMLTESVKAAKLLAEKEISTAVLNLPWLNNLDEAWLYNQLRDFKLIVTVDNHYLKLSQGEQVAGSLARTSTQHPKIISLGLDEIPACGHNGEVLSNHQLDFKSLVVKIESNL